MSIKDLFTKITTFESATSGSSDVESFEFIKAKKEKLDTFQPSVDFATASNFAKYGSAYEYYTQAIERIYGDYPYDGSDAEINEYKNNLLDIEKYIFDNLYPRTNGYAIFSNPQDGGWGGSTNDIDDADGYGIPSKQEYITFKGGPGTGSLTDSSLQSLSINDHNSKFQNSNIYDEDIYTNAGLPSIYGSGSRESNLKSDFIGL